MLTGFVVVHSASVVVCTTVSCGVLVLLPAIRLHHKARLFTKTTIGPDLLVFTERLQTSRVIHRRCDDHTSQHSYSGVNDSILR